MRHLIIDLSDDKRSKIPVWWCSCLHFGAQKHLSDLLDKWLTWAKKVKPIIILMGDMIEAALPGHHFSQGVWLQTQNPHDQIDNCIEHFQGLNVAAVFRGNHERRIYNISSVDPAKWIAERLGAEYMQFGGKIEFDMGNGLIYRAAAFHGSGLSANPKVQLDKASKIYQGFDIIAIGHLHKLYKDIEQNMTPDGLHKTHRFRCGSFIGYEEYAEELFYEPGIAGSPLSYLYKEKRIVSVNDSGFPSEE